LVGDTGIEPVTSSVSGKRATAAPIAQISTIQVLKSGFTARSGGGNGIRTRVRGFAGRCLASRPPHRAVDQHSEGTWTTSDSVLRADDEIRTRDPHLGKVMLYH
jgi:hypothetical protein